MAAFATDLQEKAVLTVFASFEAIHARSYFYIFTTLCTNTEIDELFEWVKENEFLQYKANKIGDIYNGIEEGNTESL
ncbi:ribonucleotide-diphosphate reductase subunit beta [Bacillus cereus group sp. BfR-BA-01311]|uniref:ribonucleotide-diphosphate reductase subunit beta n=1 Tax=Bacillus cereus group TaxID=86661 RepID=UPI00351D5704